MSCAKTSFSVDISEIGTFPAPRKRFFGLYREQVKRSIIINNHRGVWHFSPINDRTVVLYIIFSSSTRCCPLKRRHGGANYIPMIFYGSRKVTCCAGPAASSDGSF